MKNNIYLRKLKFEDRFWINEYFNNINIIQHLSNQVSFPCSIEESTTIMKINLMENENKNKYTFVICLKENDEPIGRVDYQKQQGNSFKRGFWLAETYWGNGYMTEAVTLSDNIMFTENNCESIKITNSIQNVASNRIKEKQGYKYLGIVDDQPSFNGETKSHLWILKKEDFLNKKS